jgi:hypothetical protein
LRLQRLVPAAWTRSLRLRFGAKAIEKHGHLGHWINWPLPYHVIRAGMSGSIGTRNVFAASHAARPTTSFSHLYRRRSGTEDRRRRTPGSRRICRSRPKPRRRPNSRNPVVNVGSPWTYGWTAKATITIAAGPESFPFYPFFNSEQEHRETLEVCQVGAAKLLKKLQNRRYDNVRREYRERLEDYLQNLPRTTGAGNILLAYDDILNLRSDFAAETDTLPIPFATDLRRVIENQFALNTFYDVVARHNEAIASATRSAPYPREALGPLNEFISANTPRLFEPNVSEAQRRLDRAGPRDAQPPAASPPKGDSSAVQPPPLPPATPDATQAHQRQTAANAMPCGKSL